MKLFYNKLRSGAPSAAAALCGVLLLVVVARADRPYAPSRDYNLENVRVALHFDLDQRRVIGDVTETLSAVRDD
jgi:hypothetical protein